MLSVTLRPLRLCVKSRSETKRRGRRVEPLRERTVWRRRMSELELEPTLARYLLGLPGMKSANAAIGVPRGGLLYIWERR